MWAWIEDKFYSQPETMMSRGRLLLSIAVAMFMAGGVNLFVGLVLAMVQRRTPTENPETLVAQLGSPWWSFWVPETPLGLTFMVVLGLCGAAQFWLGQDLYRLAYGRRPRRR